jgi:hypothetical protein
MKKICLLLCAAVVLAIPAASAQACWVDKVYMRDAGVAVRFIPNAPSRITVHSAKLLFQTYYIHTLEGYQKYIKTGQDAFDTDYVPVGKPVDAVPMAIGDNASLWNSPEDTCILHAVIEDGRLGIATGASFYDNIPGHQPITQDDFLPAEPAPAQPRP